MDMIVGVMTNFNKPTKLAHMTALISKSYDIDVIYLRPKDVDIEKGTVRGKMLINHKWVTKETKVPRFIDVVPYSFKKKNKEITDYLKKTTFLSDDRTNVLTKQELQDELEKDADFSHLVIPTHKAVNFKELLEYVNKYSKVVLKPLMGIRGRGIYVLEKEADTFILGHQKERKVMNAGELRGFFEEFIERENYILQKYVASRTLQGDPFDCRVHVEKDGDGNWASARNYIRIGIDQQVISNVNHGGGIANPEPFLKANFGENWAEINKNLNELATSLPYRVEQLRGTHIMSLGMDIGIDKSGKLYLFEVNDGPDTSAVISEVALLRSGYYNYIIKNHLKVADNKSSKREKHNKQKETRTARKMKDLQNERDYYKKKYTNMKASTSWRLTFPVRILGVIRKKFQGKKSN